MRELRCASHKLHGRVSDGASGELEVSCDNRLCGKEAGLVVLHTFDLATGTLTRTSKFKDPRGLFSTNGKGKTKEDSKCP